jgi:hypothetical protein
MEHKEWLRLLISPQAKRRLKEMSQQDGVSISNVVERLVRFGYRADKEPVKAALDALRDIRDRTAKALQQGRITVSLAQWILDTTNKALAAMEGEDASK